MEPATRHGVACLTAPIKTLGSGSGQAATGCFLLRIHARGLHKLCHTQNSRQAPTDQPVNVWFVSRIHSRKARSIGPRLRCRMRRGTGGTGSPRTCRISHAGATTGAKNRVRRASENEEAGADAPSRAAQAALSAAPCPMARAAGRRRSGTAWASCSDRAASGRTRAMRLPRRSCPPAAQCKP